MIETTENTFEIPTVNLYGFEAAMAKLTKRAKRLKLDVGFEVVRRFTREVKVVDFYGVHRKRTESYAEVRTWGPVVKFDGWSFVGKLDFAAVEGQTLRVMLEGEDCPDWVKQVERTRCDHCGHSRRRNELFIVRHEDGSEKVIGSTCVRDFLGNESPDKLAAMAGLIFSVMHTAEESEHWGGCGGHAEPVWSPTEVLATAFYSIRQHGWTPTREEGATAGDVSALLTPHRFPSEDKKRLEELEKRSEKDWAKASAAVEWIAEQDTSGSDYMHNLQAVLTNYVTYKTMNLAVSGAVAFDRDLAKKVEKQEERKEHGPSDFVGKAGDRIDFDAEVFFVRYLEGMYGTTTLIKFRDDSGNLYTWFASGSKDIERGERYAVRGTVKKHEVFRDEKQTVINRCKLKALD